MKNKIFKLLSMLPAKPNTSSSDSNIKVNSHLSNKVYSQFSNKVLEELFDFLDTKNGTIDYNKDVIEYKNHNGVYVINKQKPTNQIWLSSPISGPKRFSLKNNAFFNEKTELIEFIKKEVDDSHV